MKYIAQVRMPVLSSGRDTSCLRDISESDMEISEKEEGRTGIKNKLLGRKFLMI